MTLAFMTPASMTARAPPVILAWVGDSDKGARNRDETSWAPRCSALDTIECQGRQDSLHRSLEFAAPSLP